MRPGQADGAELADGAPVGDRSVPLWAHAFTAATATEVRHALVRHVAAAGLAGDDAEDFVLAVHELVTNAVRHGGGAGRVELLRQADVLVCEVHDHGTGTDADAVRLPAADVPGGRGLWLARELTGGLMLTRRPDGLTATVSVCLTDSSAHPAAPAGADPADPAQP
ncbi:Anti-sigma regulatory factor (Ser/Thr protein kinase) [Micromonospora echinaurantiaca]|uniref:Anti-sigma regulatory factor (Ser/Thr protein kinase) n=1 Tax=Micromonospora echinaurantiaca TaxID=47857 RepID=A0A1C5KCD3_9ACTN|nr:ATP-binding protein [Micromonospora echinaurantiaca]SCG80453.1 Anti-sigma regulatory factor (Ser/Thr protein kinase) [Micromonospora echinaurantiaca]